MDAFERASARIELYEPRVHYTLYLVVVTIRRRGDVEFVSVVHATSSLNDKFEKTILNSGHELKPSIQTHPATRPKHFGMLRPLPFHASLTAGKQVSGCAKKPFHLLVRCHDPQARGQVRMVVAITAIIQVREVLKILSLTNKAG